MNWVDAITSGAVATCASGIVIAVYQGVIGRGGRRADEAKALTDIGRGFLSEAQKDNKALRLELRGVKDALLTLTDLLDETLPFTAGIPDEHLRAIRLACRVAQRAVFELRD